MPPLPSGDYSQLVEWQKKVPNNVLLSQLTIPGTHNSAACHFSFFSVKCQGASITEQLKHGIRFFDFRVTRPFFANSCGNFFSGNPDDLQVIHGKFPVRLPSSVKLEDCLNEIYAFLQQHPSETAIISIKMEGNTDIWSGDEFPDLMWKRYFEPAQQRWFLHSSIPTMGQARGKAVLFRRFGMKGDGSQGSGWNPDNFGFPATWWKYNTPQDNRGTFDVQDWNEINKPEDVNTKTKYIQDQINRAVQFNSTAEAADPSTAKLYVNFCSGSNFFSPSCWPQPVANKIRKNISPAPAGMGIIIIDFAEIGDWEVPRKLVQSSLQTVGAQVNKQSQSVGKQSQPNQQHSQPVHKNSAQ